MSLLTRTEATLPSHWYYDAAHYQRELESIWYCDWVCVGRVDELPEPGDYLLAAIGNQSLIATRDSKHQLQVFHNTCRHRGSALCEAPRGRFANARIVCPYHTWTYSLAGDLLATPARLESEDFDLRDYPLYKVHADVWGGFLFVNLSRHPATTLTEFLGPEAEELASWPLAELRSVQRESKTVACNWKLFWENYSECYHCPRLHPELCKVVPLYRQGVLSYGDIADGSTENDGGRPHVGPGKTTWTLDGKSSLPLLDGPGETERSRGMTFASFTASMFVVGHPDYVRSVRMYPKGAEETELVIDWLLPPGTQDAHPDQVDNMLALGRLVIEQDSRACELNQQGLNSRQHEHGVLVPQEYALWEFHEWVRQRLAADPGG
ncbi:MAG: aromatic ring-hydroxylating dioxygenase subunit alpha [Woeseia sp.]